MTSADARDIAALTVENHDLRTRLLEMETKLFHAREETRGLRQQLQRMSEEKGMVAPLQSFEKGKRHKTPNGRRSDVLRICGGACFFCATELDEETLTIDHLMPLVRGGSNRFSNLVAACGACNNAKGDRMPTHAEVERAAGLHCNRKQKRWRYRPEPLQVFPLASIKLGANGRVLCPSNAHGGH